MLTKGKITLFMTLCILSLVSIGFASWTITEEGNEEVLGSMQTDNVINSAEFVSLDTTKGDLDELNSSDTESVYKGYSVFDYYEYGFLNENGVATSSGYLTAYFVVDVEKCYNFFKNNYDSISLTIQLGFASDVVTDLNLFVSESPTTELGKHSLSASCLNVPENVNVTLTNVPGSSSQTNYVRYYTSNLKFENLITDYENGIISNKISFAVQYHFTATAGEYFYQYIFQTLFKDDIDVHDNVFAVNVYVAGSNSTNS